MPGSSLWLLPPEGHPLVSLLTSEISTIASRYNPPHLFIPHVTITSDISPSTYSRDPQEWLESIEFPESKHVSVGFCGLGSEDVFVRKLYIKVVKTEGLRDLGAVARKAVPGFEDVDKAKEWAEKNYAPHLSLLYHDCPKLSDEDIAENENRAREDGINLEGKGELGGWVGGRVVLVPTDRPIKEWAPIAETRL